MPATDRSGGRTVHIYDGNDHTRLLGGLELTDGVTKFNLYEMVAIILRFNPPLFSVEDEASTIVERNQDPLLRGRYYVIGDFEVNEEPCFTRVKTPSSGTQLDAFTDGVRRRDRRCIVTGRVPRRAQFNDWRMFDAAHIFPPAYHEHWTTLGFDNLITIPGANNEAIHSVQNGMLLRTDIHGLFATHGFAINPHDNYKIICFSDVDEDIAGKHLDQQFRDAPDRPLDELLWWHYRQAVLANVRGAGEPVFEHDFPPGSDMMGEIREGPKAGERMEFELFSRFAVRAATDEQEEERSG